MSARPSRLRAPSMVVLLVLLLVVPGAAAHAAWGTSGPGTSTARGGVMTTPTGVVAGASGCAGRNAVVTYRWTAVPGAAAYQWDASPAPDYGTADYSDIVSAPTATVQRQVTLPTVQFFRVRAFAGNWSSDFSASVERILLPC